MKHCFIALVLLFAGISLSALMEDAIGKPVGELKVLQRTKAEESTRQWRIYQTYINANKPEKMKRSEADVEFCRKNLDKKRIEFLKNDPAYSQIAEKYRNMLSDKFDAGVRNSFNRAWNKTGYMKTPEYVMLEWKLYRANEENGRIGTECRLKDPEWQRHHTVFCRAYNENEALKRILADAVKKESQLKGYVCLGNRNFKVFIATPQMMHEVMKTEYYQRFDFCGAVFQISVDGRELLLYPGLVDEFGIEILPPGYSSKTGKAGELFLKYGIGVLVQRKGERYHFFRKSQIRSLAETTFRQDGNKVFFFQRQPDFNGWSYEYRKVYETIPEKRLLRISYSLKNTGKKPIHTDQYNHNFFTYGRKYVDSRYRIDTKFRIVPTRKITGYQTDGRSVYDFRKSGNLFSLEPVAAENNVVELSHPDFPLKVQIRGDFPASRFAVSFDADRYISPEIFIPLDIPPGKEVKWTRIYNFEKNASGTGKM